MLRTIRLLLAVTLASGCLAGTTAEATQASNITASTDEQLRAGSAWKQLTEVDVEAAYRLLRDNHPAASQDANDPIFERNLARAHAIAIQRAQTATTLAGYNATLREFAYSMGDGHIWSHPKYDDPSISWSGIIIAKRGVDWIVAREDNNIVGSDIIGARLVACDNKPVSTFAEQVLSFRAVSGDAAMETMRAARLLMDDGNPFLQKPRVCQFEESGNIKSINLKWQEANVDELQKTFWKTVPGTAGFGVRAINNGYWISMESLDSRAQAVIDKTAANIDSIRRSGYVVVDLRGNFGGNDLYGRKLADVLYGSGYVTDRLGAIDSGCASVFRASIDNIAASKTQITAFQASGDADGAAGYARGVQAMEAARLRGNALTGPVTCQVIKNNRLAKTPSLMRSQIFVLTDVGCFSSCINTVGFLVKLGAVQVGQMTGSDTHYSEVREISLPSGLSTFSTMMALMPDAPARIGPYIPTVPYDGDITDTAALETWVPAHALRQSAEAVQ